MKDCIETIKYKGYKINIYQDDCTESPREWDNLGNMICFHSRYNLGDKHNHSREELLEIIKRKDIIALPLYLYDHSGITINTSEFSCRWDSGQVGYIYVDFEAIKKEWKVKKVSKKLKAKIEKILNSEVNAYDEYIRGNIYGFMIEDENEDEEGGCWGYYGYEWEENGLLDSAKDEIKEIIKIKKDILDNVASQSM
ncbi:hypothetical protein LCGC14_1735770 [marine sediment metagenome]|uniref:Uncharacterized protein n=1 Tax=marine sediment metagenome TaxID=412755 RepID=A0A0F9H865_9ZZZZ